MRPASERCPDLELLAAFVDGRLRGADRDRVASHVAGCEACYFVFTESARMRAAEASAPVLDGGRRAWWMSHRIAWSSVGGALATAAALLLMVGAGWLPWQRSSSADLRALVAAVGTERTVEPRLTGGFAYGPLRGAVRAGEPVAAIIPPDVRIAAANIEKETIAHRTPQTLQALGAAYLVMGDVDRAVSVLEEAADQPKPDPRIENDLAAAYLVRAPRNNQPQDFAKALAMADRAVKADPKTAEAWFNRAYALERLSLAGEARQAWQDYLKIDNASGWASEARAHLRALESGSQIRSFDEEKQRLGEAAARGDAVETRTVVVRSPEAAREWVQDQLLTVWSGAIVDRRAQDAGATLARADLVAKQMAAANGDRFMADAVGAAAVATRGGQASALADAQLVFGHAVTDYMEDRIRESVGGFERALPAFDRANTAYAVWASLFLAIGRYYAGDFTTALRLLDSVSKAANDRGYIRIEGLARRVRGLVHVVQGDFAGGAQEYRSAIALFARAGDVDNGASMHALLAEDLDFLGETDLAWTESSSGLAQLGLLHDRRYRHTVLQLSSLALLRQGLPEAAAYFQHALLDNATQWARPLAIVDAHLYQGEIDKQVGDVATALVEFDAAKRTLATVSDAGIVARNEAQIALARGEVESTIRPGPAIERLTGALAYFRGAHRNWPIARVLLARGRAHVQEGRDDLAETDFAEGIDLFEDRRAAVADEALRSASFEQPWDLYSEMIRLQAVRLRRPDRALVFAERSRARTLLEAMSASAATMPADPAAARLQLPPNVTVLYYATLEDRLLIWVLTRARSTFLDTQVRQTELIHLLERYRAEMTGSIAPRDTPSLAILYDLLVRPIAGSVADGSQIVVIPDGVLHAVPFAALLRREDRRYLVEDHALAVAPSLTTFIAASRKSLSSNDHATALVLGNPRVEGDGAEGLADLPEAEAEARDVAALYGHARLLLGRDATKRAFVRDAGGYDVVHFAGHAIANDRRPELSRLLLAGPEESDRSLFARDIAKESFASTRLVVLGACRTSAGRIRRGEGVFSLARPFLAAGVPVVIASLWDVDDHATRRLLVAFHRALGHSASVSEALRRAQLEVMSDADPTLQNPAAWSGFTAIGGATDARTNPRQ